MNSDLKDNNLNNNNNDAINMFNVHVILNSFKIIISDMIMYKHILLRLRIESVNFIKLCIKL